MQTYLHAGCRVRLTDDCIFTVAVNVSGNDHVSLRLPCNRLDLSWISRREWMMDGLTLLFNARS